MHGHVKVILAYNGVYEQANQNHQQYEELYMENNEH
jgi:hypothetical protein